MVFWFIDRLSSPVPEGGSAAPVYLTARIGLAAVMAFVTTLVFGPSCIRWLRSRYGERIDSASERLNELHAAKAGTPSMGGVFMSTAIVLSVLAFGNLTNSRVWMALFVTVTFTVLGCLDDWIKLTTKKRGLTARQKLVGQIVLSIITAVWLYQIQVKSPHGTAFVWPFGLGIFTLGVWLIPWAAFVIVSSSNAVNLTDGLDGLASGCTLFAGGAVTLAIYLSGHKEISDYLGIPHFIGVGELAVPLGAMVGAVLGFLWFNVHPAKVFMGDAGALPLGALLAVGALATRLELFYAIVGGVFVAETLSVMLQVTSRRLRGKKILACSPLHNHFVFEQMPETRIVVRFWIVSALLALLGLISLKTN
ncbi:MAG: phospho-N-acetylmuramoyl-pentapeptide-transferase [Planctomycetota bacterium]|nr:MAG: phospho-N-acetylmuramoyl-pentapeptide-transferase [Planctomycetota bacterium]